MTWKTITLALAIGAAGTAAVFAPQPAEALPSNIVERYYYSDATFTTEVGYMLVTTCSGVVNQLTGTKTAFVKQFSEPCNEGPMPSPKCTVHGIVVPCGYF